jgi:hypothetical protein
MSGTRLGLLVLLSVNLSGCWFAKKSAPKITSPVSAPQPAAPQPAAPVPAAVDPTPPPPPVVETEAPVVPTPEPLPVTAPRETPAPKPVVRRNPTPPPAAPPVAPATPAPPSLQEILSGAQRKQYETEYSQGVARATAALKQAAGRTLNASQQETTSRIRTFLTQAGAMRNSDISTALQLARRADLLSQELLKSLR